MFSSVNFRYMDYMVYHEEGVTYFTNFIGIRYTFKTLEKCLSFIDAMYRRDCSGRVASD